MAPQQVGKVGKMHLVREGKLQISGAVGAAG